MPTTALPPLTTTQYDDLVQLRLAHIDALTAGRAAVDADNAYTPRVIDAFTQIDRTHVAYMAAVTALCAGHGTAAPYAVDAVVDRLITHRAEADAPALVAA